LAWPGAQGTLQQVDAVEQVTDQADGGVVERQAGVQALDAGDGDQLGRGEPQLAGSVADRPQQPEGDQPADQLGVEAGAAGEALEAETHRPRQGVASRLAHRPLLGSKVEALASSSSSFRSRRLNCLGTMIRTSAYRSPGRPLGLGMPWPRRRSRRPLEEPGGTFTFTSPPGVSTGTGAPTAASRGLTGRSTWR